jgi:hypothetical protein
MSDADPAVQRLRDDLTAALGRHPELTTEQRAAALATLLQTLLEPERKRESNGAGEK